MFFSVSGQLDILLEEKWSTLWRKNKEEPLKSSETFLSTAIVIIITPASPRLSKMKRKEDLNPMLLLLFHLMVFIYTTITFLPSYLLSWGSRAHQGSYGSEKDRAKIIKARSVLGCPEGPYRAVSSSKRLASVLRPGVNTLDKIFAYASTQFPYRDCLGTREVISEEDERQSNGKVFKKVRSHSLKHDFENI